MSVLELKKGYILACGYMCEHVCMSVFERMKPVGSARIFLQAVRVSPREHMARAMVTMVTVCFVRKWGNVHTKAGGV